MPRNTGSINVFVSNLPDGDQLIKILSEHVLDYEKKDEEDTDQNSFEKNKYFAKIDIKEITDK